MALVVLLLFDPTVLWPRRLLIACLGVSDEPAYVYAVSHPSWARRERLKAKRAVTGATTSSAGVTNGSVVR